MIHGNTFCPVHKEPVLPDEDGNCSLCSSTFKSKRYFCIECSTKGKRRASFPFDPKFKEHAAAHIESHT